MYSTVKRLRERGKRKHDREIQADEGATGVLTLANVAGIYELQVTDRGDSQMKPLIPVLLDAKLVTLGSSRMLFRGYEDAGRLRVCPRVGGPDSRCRLGQHY